MIQRFSTSAIFTDYIQVFSIIMNENAGAEAWGYNRSINEVRFKGNLVHTQARRFVVVRAKHEFCYAW